MYIDKYFEYVNLLLFLKGSVHKQRNDFTRIRVVTLYNLLRYLQMCIFGENNVIMTY